MPIRYSQQQNLMQKNDDNNFDNAMGSFHGAEIGGLPGLFLLDKLKTSLCLRT